ncbi:hypothetical protein NIES4071_11120 [Calothrix sp. NIES-4071]|nr:hypothetical protein NIES4071_11120 [Calothrix sp. NIES-4071]BAZ55452.1 hypothetical protein NIES4105_11080 [Calothrix sp. NIES-4105]
MTKFELIYNCVHKYDEQTICNSNIIRRAVSSNHAESLIEGASMNAVVAVASPLACPIQLSSEISAYVEKMGYYLGGGADT